MSDNVVKMSKKSDKIPTSVIDKMKSEYDQYIIIALTKDGEMAYSIDANSHGNAFQMLLIAGGHVYKDQFAP